MAKTKAPEQRDSASTRGTLAVEAALNAAHTETRLKLTGAGPGGHAVDVIAMTLEDKRIDVGRVSWDGDRGDITVPFVARAFRIMNDVDDPDRVEVVVDVLQDFIEDNTPPPPEADPPVTRSTGDTHE